MMQFFREEKGQTSIEYMLVVALIIVVISVFGKTFSQQIPNVVGQVFASINSKIQVLMSASVGT